MPTSVLQLAPLVVLLLYPLGYLSRRTSAGTAASLLAVGTLLALILLALPLARRRHVSFALALLLVMVALTREQTQQRRRYLGLPRAEVTWFCGTIQRDASQLNNGLMLFSVTLSQVGSAQAQASAHGSVTVFAPARSPPLWWGERVHIGGTLRPSMLRPRQLTSYASAVTVEGSRWRPFRLRARAKSALLAYLERHLSADAYALSVALLLGNKDQLSPRIKEAFRRAGLSHLLAMSGFHLTLLASLLGWVVGPLLGQKASSLLLVLLLIGYLLLVGVRPSLNRALLMFMLLQLRHFALPPPSFPHLLASAFLLQLLIFPQDAYSLGMQLSYAALCGLIWLAPRWQLLLPGKTWFTAPLAATLAATVSTAPLTLLFFGQVYPVGLLATPLLSPLVSLYLFALPLALPLLLVAPLSPYLELLLNLFTWLLLKAVSFFAQAPALNRNQPLPLVLFFLWMTIDIYRLFAYDLWYQWREGWRLFGLGRRKAGKRPADKNAVGRPLRQAAQTLGAKLSH